MITSRTGPQSEFPQLHFFEEDYEGYLSANKVDIVLEEFIDYVAYISDVSIAKNGKYSLLGAANSKAVLIDNTLYQTESKINIFKDRAIFNTSNNDPIEQVAFSEDQKYLATLSLSTKTENERVIVLGNEIYYYQAEPFPYIEFNTNEKDGMYYSLGEIWRFNYQRMSKNTHLFFWEHMRYMIRMNSLPPFQRPNIRV